MTRAQKPTFPAIIIDTREQAAWSFRTSPQLPVIATKRAGLKTGDYSLEGYEAEIAIERKSLDDFIGCCMGERERFERELLRAQALTFFAVIVEAEFSDVWRGEYVSRILPQSVIGSAAAFTLDYCPVVFAGSAPHAADFALRLMHKFWRQKVGLRGEKPAEGEAAPGLAKADP